MGAPEADSNQRASWSEFPQQAAAQRSSPAQFATMWSRRKAAARLSAGGPAQTQDFARLFLVPGSTGCPGFGDAEDFNTFDAIQQWVEKGKAPDVLNASHMTNGKVDRTRPLCPYPQVAKYKGTGSIDDAANFTCSAP